MSEFDLIVGIHSIAAAIQNSEREIIKLVLSDEGEEELLKRSNLNKAALSKINVERVSGHKLQELAKEYYKQLELEYHRVPSQVFLIASKLKILETTELYSLAKKESIKLLCLDQISDVNNAAAIIRTAAFYAVDAVILPGKKSFGLTPSFFRIASGATEYIKLINASNLTKVISKLNELGVITIGLSEHANKSLSNEVLDNSKKVCLVLGKEDTGISNAVMRQVTYELSLTPKGEIKSLNVSAAAAISMEKCFK